MYTYYYMGLHCIVSTKASIPGGGLHKKTTGDMEKGKGGYMLYGGLLIYLACFS